MFGLSGSDVDVLFWVFMLSLMRKPSDVAFWKLDGTMQRATISTLCISVILLRTRGDGMSSLIVSSPCWSSHKGSRIERIQMLDELEEWILINQHYCISWASYNSGPNTSNIRLLPDNK